ncbi:MAG: folate-binding protein [Burkholderiales bacterium]
MDHCVTPSFGTAKADRPSASVCSRLQGLGALLVSGSDARAFLHAQLTNDVEHLPENRARLAGWCTAKGRLLASFLVIPSEEGYLLQLARDLAPFVAKKLSMFVLRSKVTISDVSQDYLQLGIWGEESEARLVALGLEVAPGELALSNAGGIAAIRMGEERFLLLGPAQEAAQAEARLALPAAPESDWTLAEIRAGRPLIVHATQDLFVPQMVNLEAVGGVDFKKGCYPGQEIVARAQYRGQVKRRMVRARAGSGVTLAPAQDLYSDDLPGQASGTVVSVAPTDGTTEILAVVPVTATTERTPIRVAPGGPTLEILELPYST